MYRFINSSCFIFQDKREKRRSVEKCPETSDDAVMILDPAPQEIPAPPVPRLYPEIPSAPSVTEQYTGEGL